MFEGSLPVNLLVFLAGQVAAWGYLRTGLVRRGIVLVVLSWGLADVALLARYAYGEELLCRGALLGMQALCSGEIALFTFLRLRRRGAAFKRRRDRWISEAFRHYLRDEREAASEIYRRVLRRDPWDLEAKLGLGTALARSDERRRARRLFRAVRGLDREGRWADVVAEELMRLRP